MPSSILHSIPTTGWRVGLDWFEQISLVRGFGSSGSFAYTTYRFYSWLFVHLALLG